MMLAVLLSWNTRVRLTRDVNPLQCEGRCEVVITDRGELERIAAGQAAAGGDERNNYGEGGVK